MCRAILFRGLRVLCLLSVLGFGLPAWAQQGRLIEPSAIGVMGTLSKQAFDQRYPAQADFDPHTLVPAWYVVYQHHDLAYYFGPIRWQVTAWDYQGQFEQLLQAAVQQRPSIVDYQLTVQYLPPSAIPVGERAPALDTLPETEPEPWWLRLRRLFF